MDNLHPAMTAALAPFAPPAAAQLADLIDKVPYRGTHEAAAELRRLHAINQELLKAIKECRNAIQDGQPFAPYDSRGAGLQQYFGIAFVEYLNTTIAKAEGGAA